MIKLRKYTYDDAKTVIKWITDEKAFRLWCADRFKSYPLSAEDFNTIYKEDPSAFFGMIAEDEGEVIGHFFVQASGSGTYNFGLIIVDSTKRGKGYGRQMLEAALVFAKEQLSANRIILSAFDTNPSAYFCYKNLGFKETGNALEYCFFDEKHKYIELEYVF